MHLPRSLLLLMNGWIWTCFQQRSFEPFASHKKKTGSTTRRLLAVRSAAPRAKKKNPARRLLRSNRRFSTASIPKTAARPPFGQHLSPRCSDVPRYPPNERPPHRPGARFGSPSYLLFAKCVRSWMRTLGKSKGPGRLNLRQREREIK